MKKNVLLIVHQKKKKEAQGFKICQLLFRAVDASLVPKIRFAEALHLTCKTIQQVYCTLHKKIAELSKVYIGVP